jgi:Bax protein
MYCLVNFNYQRETGAVSINDKFSAVSMLCNELKVRSMSTTQDHQRKLELLVAAAMSVAMIVLILLLQQLPSPAKITTPTAIVESTPIVVFPDFASIVSVNAKKQQFFDYLQDYINAENIRIASVREQLLSYADIVNSGAALSRHEREWLFGLEATYRPLVGLDSDKEIVQDLLLRVDEIPVSLVLAQAANESAWGTSRFATEGNNIFGQWCFVEGCGIVPKRRATGAIHEVKSFVSIEEAVEAYFLNINSNQPYDYFRELRAFMRDQQQDLDSLVLAFGLGAYSQRGDRYVDEVQTLILQNDLKSRDNS